jgi:hypothetical protein
MAWVYKSETAGKQKKNPLRSPALPKEKKIMEL